MASGSGIICGNYATFLGGVQWIGISCGGRYRVGWRRLPNLSSIVCLFSSKWFNQMNTLDKKSNARTTFTFSLRLTERNEEVDETGCDKAFKFVLVFESSMEHKHLSDTVRS